MRILSFSLSNYRSFKEEQKIIFGTDEKNVTTIYGPNGAGKSNLFLGLSFFCDFIKLSTKFEGQSMRYEPFLLCKGAKDRPTTFDAEFIAKNHQFRYRFSLLNGKVTDEALGSKTPGTNGKYHTIYSRPTIPKGNYGDFYRDVLKRTRDDALVLTKAWEDNDKYALEIFEWLAALKTINTNDLPVSQSQTAAKIMSDDDFKARVLDLMRRTDLYIQDINVSEVQIPKKLFDILPFTEEAKKGMSDKGYTILTTHLLRDVDGQVVGVVPLSMLSHESAGTQRIFELAYPILNAIDSGGILYIDSFENDLHPNECQFLVALFEKENPQHAQLIVNTHSTTLQNQVGRDNIRLVSKTGSEETIISEVSKSIKPGDRAIERKYQKGLLGAVPAIRS